MHTDLNIVQLVDYSAIFDTKKSSSTVEQMNLTKIEEPKEYFIFTPKKIKWSKAISLTIMHLIALYGLFTFPYIQRFKTFLWLFLSKCYTGFGITGGIHRYWTHRSYKAKMPMRILLAFCYLSAYQMKIWKWVTYHRTHHKYTETDADPHNSNRGFFFSHMGWMMIEKHPQVKEKVRLIDISDIKKDSVANFVDRHFVILTVLCQLFAIWVPVYFWDEEWYYAIMAQIIRFILATNYTCSVNSFAHLWGYKPYDKNIAPAENKYVALFAIGEGWHNFHHVFPYDYRMAEGSPGKYDITGAIIRLFEKIGWVYDLRTASNSLVKNTAEKRGDENRIKTILSKE